MIVGETLDYVTDRIPAAIHKGDGQPYYLTRNLFAFIASHGVYCGLFAGPAEGHEFFLGADLPESFDLTMHVDERPAIVAVKSDTFPDGEHYVFWDGRVIRDPSALYPDEMPRDKYRVIEWFPLTYCDDSAELP